MAPWWRDGTFMDNWLRTVENSMYVLVADQQSEPWLAAGASWAAIVTEFGLAVGVLIPPLSAWVALIGSSFHSTTFLLSGSTFSLFMPAMICSYLCFADLEKPMRVGLRGSQRIVAGAERLRRWTAPDRPIEIGPPREIDAAFLVVERADRSYRGVAGLVLLALFNPAVIAAFMGFLAAHWIPVSLKLAAVVAGLLLSLPLMASVALDKGQSEGTWHRTAWHHLL